MIQCDDRWFLDEVQDDPEFERQQREHLENDRKMPVEQWLAIRKQEAVRVDPEIALVEWDYGQIFDPYGVDPNLPPEYRCAGRNYFARNRGSYIWVSFHDLPVETCRALYERLDQP
jgi:hypothetical protein